jgi:hypothetical protein
MAGQQLDLCEKSDEITRFDGTSLTKLPALTVL